MAYTIAKVDIWVGSIVDRPGAVAEKLAPLAEAGAKLEFLLARRDKAKKGLIFVAPIKGAKQAAAVKKAGLKKGAGVAGVRIEGPDKAGLGAVMSAALGKAGVNMRGISAMALGRKSVFYLAFDKAQDAAKAKRVLAKALK